MAGRECPDIRYSDFIARMDLAYAMADVVISRSGASSISELCAAHKAAVFVPSPNVAEDHQTKNAMALVNKDAALMVKDVDAPKEVISLALATVMDEKKLSTLSENVKKLGLPASADIIADEVLKLAEKK